MTAAGAPWSRVAHYAWVVLAFGVLVLSAVFRLEVVAVLALLSGVAALVIVDIRAALTLSFPIYGLVGATVSVAIIESGTYVTEQYRHGFDIGATGVLGLYALAFLTVGHLAVVWLCARAPSRTQVRFARPLTITVIAICGAIALFYLIVFLLYGTALGTATRFDWSAGLPEMVALAHRLIRTYLIPMAFAIAGVAVVFGGPRVLAPLAVLGLPVVAMFVAGDKFGAFIVSITMGLLGVGVGGFLRNVDFRLNRYYLIGAVVLFALLVGALVVGYMRTGAESAIQAISQRVALQGHVWFGIFDRFAGLPGVSLAEMVGENTRDRPTGLDALSYLVSRPDFVYERLGRGVSFTMGGPATALAAFGGTIGIVVYALTAILYVAVIVGFCRFLAARRYLLALVVAGLYVIAGSATQMGYWDSLVGPVAIAGLGAIVLGMLGHRLRLLSRRRNGAVPSRGGNQ